MLRAIYLRSHQFATPIIRTRFPGDWVHCGIVTPDDTVIEATFFHGVQEVKLWDVIKRASKFEIVGIHCLAPEEGIKWARTQIGVKYDLAGALGLGFRRDWQDPSKWFCSELLEQALVKSGRVRFRSKPWRIDPQMSYEVR